MSENTRWLLPWSCILVPRGRAPFGQHQESRPLAKSNTGSPRFTDFPSLCACSESSLTNLIGSGLNLLCLLSHSKTECRWTRPEVAILGADQKERSLWGRECWSCRISRACAQNVAKLFHHELLATPQSKNYNVVPIQNICSYFCHNFHNPFHFSYALLSPKGGWLATQSTHPTP